MATTNRIHLLATFERLATEVAEREFKAVGEGTSIAELGIDSLGMLEIIGSLERALDVRIPDEALAGILTVRDLLNAVEARQTRQGDDGSLAAGLVGAPAMETA